MRILGDLNTWATDHFMPDVVDQLLRFFVRFGSSMEIKPCPDPLIDGFVAQAFARRSDLGSKDSQSSNLVCTD